MVVLTPNTGLVKALLGCAHNVCLEVGNGEEGKNFAGMGNQGDDALAPVLCGLFVLHVFPIPAPDPWCSSPHEKGMTFVVIYGVVQDLAVPAQCCIKSDIQMASDCIRIFSDQVYTSRGLNV
jgi:hypothetical protein